MPFLRTSLLPSAVRICVRSPDPVFFLGGGCTVLVHSPRCSGRGLCRIHQLFNESVFQRTNWEDLLLGTGSCFLGPGDAVQTCAIPARGRREGSAGVRREIFERSVTSSANIFFESALREQARARETVSSLWESRAHSGTSSAWDGGWRSCRRSKMLVVDLPSAPPGVLLQVVPSSPSSSQTKLLQAPWGTSCGDGYAGLELGVAVGLEMTFWKCKAQQQAESIWSPSSSWHVTFCPSPWSRWRPWGQGQLVVGSGGARKATGRQRNYFF